MKTNKNGLIIDSIIVIIALIIIGGGIYAYKKTSYSLPLETISTTTPSHQENQIKTYKNVESRYEISYPSDYVFSDNEALFVDPSIKAVKIAYPASFSAGTNLDSASIRIATSSSCATTFKEFPKSSQYSIQDNMFTVYTTGDAAMGGARAIETIYTIQKNNTCYIVEKALLYHDINFLVGAGVKNPPKAYDENAINSVFMKILSSFTIEI